MISRSNSNAGNRLQRQKSVASTRTTTSSHQRSATSIDPFTTRQQAESAAVEAYFRLRQQQPPAPEPYHPTPPKLQRRKSQVTGRTEGSHLEDARLGRRQSTSRRVENGRPKASGTNQHASRALPQSGEVDNGERIITRRRSVIQPNQEVLRQNHAYLTAPSSARPTRTSQSGYSDGSPAPRHPQPTSHDLSTSRSRTSHSAHDRSRRLSEFPAFDSSHGVLHDQPVHRRASIREYQTDDDILAMARDKCLLDFQQGKLRQRRSFLQVAFPKRHSTTSDRAPTSHDNFDRALPPFNSADDPPPPRAQVLPWETPAEPPVSRCTTRKGRSFTSTLKGRFMKVMGKTPKTSGGMPAQHVVAQRHRYTLDDPASLVGIDRDIESASQTEKRAAQFGDAGDSCANGSGRSRVTSWTNSTMVGTVHGQTHPTPVPIAGQHDADIQSQHQHHSLRKTSSFFGRSIRNKLRRPSRSEMNASEESQRLYSALQAHMEPSEPDYGELKSEQPASSRTASALSTLPSQQRSTSEVRSQPSTIRTVTPNPAGHHFRVPSPVAEVASPPQSGERAPLAAPPSQEQIARRVQKSQTRWQSQLHTFRTGRPGLDDDLDNPYGLPSLRRHIADESKATPTMQLGQRDLMSPSVYSQTTGLPSRPDTPADHSGTIVKITGREVRRYSISPKKTDVAPQMVQGSAEWRRWLAGEMTAFQPAYEEETMQRGLDLNDEISPTEVISGNESDGFQVKTRRTRPRPTSRKSSFMNDRYPMIDGSRNSSDRSIQSRRVSSAETREASNQPVSANKVIHNVKSVANLDHSQRSSKPAQDLSKTAQRPKSALELRAQYKTRAVSTARPLEVRRKTAQDAKVTHGSLSAGENTIRDISAGPYAMQFAGKDNKENSPMINPAAPALPTLPSSEWLAAGSSKPRHASVTPLSIGNRNVSRYSPGKSSPGGKNSPAQRMVTQFLEDREKKSREGTPSFV